MISVDSLLARDSHKRLGDHECGFIRRKYNINGDTALEDTSEDDAKHLIHM